MPKQIALATLPETWGGMTREEQAETVFYLQSKLGMKQAEIAATAGVKPRRIKSRMDDAKAFMLTGAIPTGNLNIEVDREEMVDVEMDRRDRNQIRKQGKNVISFEVYRSNLLKDIKAQFSSPIPLAEYKESKAHVEGEEEPLLVISDFHYCREENGFNEDVAEKAIQRYTDECLSIVERHRKHTKINSINVAILGDILHGNANYAWQDREVTGNSSQQIVKTAYLLIKVLSKLATHFKNVRVYLVPGNHGRKSKQQNCMIDNIELDMYEIVRAYFAHSDKFSFTMPNGNFYIIAESLGYKYLLMHGDTIKAGDPGRLIEAVKRYEDVLPPFSSAVMGHWHRLQMLPLPRKFGDVTGRYLFSNGTASAEDSFLEALGTSPSLSWWLIFNNKKRTTAAYPIDLYEKAFPRQVA
jgi:UDP-2,3-diacylglucosamine pyrophosphatase LpxH